MAQPGLLPLIFILTAWPAAGAREVVPGCSPTTHVDGVASFVRQDAIDELKSMPGPFFAVANHVGELWKNEALQERLRALPADPALPPHVLIGVGMFLASKDERTPLPALLDVMSNGRLDLSQKEELKAYVLVRYHDKRSVFGELEALLDRCIEDESKFVALLPLFDFLVTCYPRHRPPAVDRFNAVERLLGLWARHEARLTSAGVAAMRRTLVTLCGGELALQQRREWEAWFARFRGDAEVKSLALPDIYHEIIERARRENAAIRQKRQTETALLIQRLVAAGEVPIRFLADDDSNIRKTAGVALRRMSEAAAPGSSEALTSEARKAACEQIAAQLQDESLSRDVFIDLVSAAGDLAPKATDESKAALARGVLARSFENDPAATLGQIVAIGRVGVIDDQERLSAIYRFASRPPERLTAPPWVDVRSNVVKVVEVVKQGVPMVVRALDDPAPAVRGVAAAILRSLDQCWSADTVAALATRIAKEESPATRGRMLEAVLAMARKDTGSLGDESLKKVISAYSLDDENTSRLVVAIAGVAFLQRPDLSDELKASIVTLLKSTLEGTGSDELKATAVDVLVGRSTQAGLAVLREWFDRQQTRTKAWSKALAALVDRGQKDPGAIWKLAEGIAGKKRPELYDEAAKLGLAAVSTIEKAAADDPRLDGFRETLTGWQLEGTVPAQWEAALRYVSDRLADNPETGRFLAMRGRLHHKLAESRKDPQERRAGLAAGERDLARALGASIDLGGYDVAEMWRELAWMRIELGRWAACREALKKLGELKAKTPEDVWLEARSMVPDRSVLRDDVLGLLAGLPASLREALGDRLHLARATALALDVHASSYERARRDLAKVENADAPLALALKAHLDAADEVKKALGAFAGAESPPGEVKAVLAAHPELTVSQFVGDLRDVETFDEARGRRVVALIKELFAGDATISKISWPARANGQAGRALATQLSRWWVAREAPQKIVGPFLKGT